jgi:hypothetical protein
MAEGCVSCGTGTYSVAVAITVCSNCDAGKFLIDARTDATLHDDESDCSICGAGNYTASAGSATCTTCIAGTYLVEAGTDANLHD